MSYCEKNGVALNFQDFREDASHESLILEFKIVKKKSTRIRRVGDIFASLADSVMCQGRLGYSDLIGLAEAAVQALEHHRDFIHSMINQEEIMM